MLAGFLLCLNLVFEFESINLIFCSVSTLQGVLPEMLQRSECYKSPLEFSLHIRIKSQGPGKLPKTHRLAKVP